MSYWLNGVVFESNELSLPVDSPLVHFGVGLFETLLFRDHKIYFSTQHKARLVQALLKTGLINSESHPLIELAFSKGLTWISTVCSWKAAAVKILVYPDRQMKLNVLITFRNLKTFPDAISLKDQGRVLDMPYRTFKSVHYFDLWACGVLFNPEQDVVWKTREGLIAEAGKASLALVKQDGSLWIVEGPPILPGVTLSMTLKENIFVKVYPCKGFTRTDIENAEEMIYLNSIVGALPVIRLEHLKISHAGWAEKIQKKLFGF